ncbi:MAG TPA: hypothetical protein V6D17_10850 [Candidatus Obscuribacterales bacterium]
MNEPRTDELSSWLCLSQQLAEVLALLVLALAKLAEKRVTLEEKMIAAYFHKWIRAAAHIIASIHEVYGLEKKQEDQFILKEGQALISEMLDVLKEFHKTIDYSWNFLEQYYEHGFYARLQEELKFLERLDALKERVSQAGS